MDWKYFKDEKPNNNEEILVWFDDAGIDLLTYSERHSGYWSCVSEDHEIFFPDRWCRIVPPKDEK